MNFFDEYNQKKLLPMNWKILKIPIVFEREDAGVHISNVDFIVEGDNPPISPFGTGATPSEIYSDGFVDIANAGKNRHLEEV